MASRFGTERAFWKRGSWGGWHRIRLSRIGDYLTDNLRYIRLSDLKRGVNDKNGPGTDGAGERCFVDTMRPTIPRQVFEAALERVRLSFELCVYGYVVMPEHVHLLLSEPQQQTLADAIKSLKQGVSRRLIGEAEHFWQKRYYDFNVGNEPQFVEKLRYIHRNPVKRGLCARAEDWEWSSFSPVRDGLRRESGD